MNETMTALNGVNLEQLMGTIDAIKNDPEIAKFTFRSTTEWIDGGHSRTTVKNFYGAKQEDTSRAHAMIIEGDEPGVLLGHNHGPNAVEAVLHALASCVSVGIVYNAAALGIKIEDLSFDLEGDIDLNGFLGLDKSVRPGYNNVKMKVNVNSDTPREKLEELMTYVQETSPVLDIVRRPTPVQVELV